MNNTFKRPQIIKNIQLPFSNTAELKKWQASLKAVGGKYNYQEILYIVQSLKRMNLSVKDHFKTLEVISTYLIISINRFDKHYQENEFPLTFEQSSKVEIIFL